MAYPSIANYTIVEQIGEGGFGIIYQAIQVNTGQQVALKVLKVDPDITPDPQQLQHRKARFDREIQLCAQLRHPHIVQLLDQGQTQDGAPFAVFEYVEGTNLKQYILQSGALSAQTTELLMGQVLDALVCAHGQGIVHRDLKPQNIMVAQTGAAPHIKVLDFGIGAFTHEYRPQDYKSLTLTKEMVGTPSYSAPEQLRGEPPTVKSDLYAWGLILVECLTGKTVIEGSSLAEIFKQQLDSAHITLPAAIIGHDLAPLLRRVLNKNPRARVGDAAKLYEEYQAINFNTIVGTIAKATPGVTIDEEASTLDSDMELVQGQTNKRQMTVLCVQLSLELPRDCTIESEILDTLQKDQLNSCSDTIVRYGGYVKGRLGNCMMAYFGYPQVSDNAARRAGRTALELVSQAQKRASLLGALHGIALDIRISLHADETLVRQNQAPEGLTPDVAFNLLREAPPQSVWVSDTTKQLLDPYLEFEVVDQYEFANTTSPIQIHALMGERQTEAMSFLRPWSANRQMIGRDSEKQQVVDLWNQVKNGQGRSTLISGQAGIGKSKLTYEAKKQLRSEGFVVRECRCLPEQANNALFPFFDMLRKHWGMQENEIDKSKETKSKDTGSNITILEQMLAEINADLPGTLPILCSWLSIPLSENYEIAQDAPEKQKEILLNTLEQLILNIAKGASFLLIIEDLHWLDPTSQEFLERLLSRLEQQNYLLLMTTRPHFDPKWTYQHLTSLELQPLNKDFIQHMIQEVLGDQPVDDKVVSYIAERADGIPLFIEELTHMLEEQHYLVLENGTYQLDEKQDAEAVPVTLKDLLNTRLDRLGLAKETAQLAATIGRNFDYDLLVSASLRDEASIQADLDELMNADLVYRQRRVQGESYIFRHALIRDAAYEGMPKAAQKDTHSRIATTLETGFLNVVEDNPFEVARHFAGGEVFEKASQYGVKMVEKQVNNSSNEEAVSMGDWVLEQVNAIDHEATRLDKEFDVLNTLFSAVMAVGGYGSDKLITLSNRLRELVELFSQQDATQENDAQEKQREREEIIWKNDWTLFLNAHYKPERAKALKLGTRLLENARQMNNREKEMVVLGQYAQCFLKDGHHEDSVKYFKQAIDLYNEQEDDDQEIIKKYGTHPKAYGLSLIAQPMLHLGTLKEAFGYIDQGAIYSAEIGNETGIAFSYILQALIMAFCENEKGIETIIKTFEQKHQDKTESEGYFLQYLYIFEYYRLRQVDKAEDMVQMIYDSGQLFAISWYVIFLIKIHLDQGNVARAIELAERTHLHNLENDIEGSTCFVKKTLAMCYYAQDQKLTPRIDQLLKESLEYAEKQGAHFFELDTLVYHLELLQSEGGNDVRMRHELRPKLQVVVQKLGEVNDLNHHIELKNAWSQYNKALDFIQQLMPQDQALV